MAASMWSLSVAVDLSTLMLSYVLSSIVIRGESRNAVPELCQLDAVMWVSSPVLLQLQLCMLL